MSTALAERHETPSMQAIEQVLVTGDLAQLKPEQRLAYYHRICESLGLNPLTKPFAYISLNGKLVLYALKDATEQLRKLHAVSIVELTSQRLEDVFVVTAKAQDKGGRTDAATGAVAIGSLKGEALANALMKAETKAKRRVTLSICGLGMLDETEVETVPQAQVSTQTNGIAAPPETVTDTRTGEVVPASEKPEPPAGYRYIDGYKLSNNGWHELTFNTHDPRLIEKLSTKKDQLGALAARAYQQGIPVKVTAGEKRNARPGEAWLNAIELWHPKQDDLPVIDIHADLDAEPVDLKDIPFLWLLPALLTLGGLA
jgi:hypothetical protein